ncbi:MAG: carbohydrate binding domain-containing protein, partial [Anaerohalosphaera sp.]|nr:carbohydrate binding domain-containing protein [Anaerohalosphaera sp.]
MNRIFTTGLVLIITATGACFGQFVPFVISEKPNPDSPISVPYKPVAADGERIIVKDGHFSVADERIRLWGVNLSFGANLPSHEDAPFVAARMAASGINTVRLHHLDTSFFPRGIWDGDKKTEFSKEALDRLDFFIDQLAKHGIYVNLNLHVGRKHSKYLAIEESERQYDKITTIFTPVLIDAQKKYAKDLLDRTNRYRNVRYADDPAVAIVEITNENSFFMWDGESTLRNLPDYYADILQDKFNRYLLGKYGSTDSLARAWCMGQQELGSNLINKDKWKLEQHNECKAGMSVTSYKSTNAIKIEISKIDDTDWHLQINQGGLKLEKSKYYTLSFKAASEGKRKIGVSVGQAHGPWKNLGLSSNVQSDKQWQNYSFGFVASDDDDNGRVNFSFGDSSTSLYLAEIELRPGG